MKNKSLTYLLLGGVLLIWGLVFYKIFMGMDSETDTIYIPSAKKLTQVKIEQKEELVLLKNYRDPFLGIIHQSNSTIVEGKIPTSKPKLIKVRKEEVQIDWSFVDYIGLVYNKETKKNVGLLAVSGKEYMVNDKDIINDILIHKKERDSILVEYKSTKKWIRR